MTSNATTMMRVGYEPKTGDAIVFRDHGWYGEYLLKTGLDEPDYPHSVQLISHPVTTLCVRVEVTGTSTRKLAHRKGHWVLCNVFTAHKGPFGTLTNQHKYRGWIRVAD